jgi:hypothetical protein
MLTYVGLRARKGSSKVLGIYMLSGISGNLGAQFTCFTRKKIQKHKNGKGSCKVLGISMLSAFPPPRDPFTRTNVQKLTRKALLQEIMLLCWSIRLAEVTQDTDVC